LALPEPPLTLVVTTSPVTEDGAEGVSEELEREEEVAVVVVAEPKETLLVLVEEAVTKV
jgi:UPF0288 family protein (methanogenesis marker protein 3)